jgi:hypothetical protein
LELVYEELLHIHALSHLSTSIKRELASIIVFESHAQAGTVCELNFKYQLLYWFHYQFNLSPFTFFIFVFFRTTMHVQKVKYCYDSTERKNKKKQEKVYIFTSSTSAFALPHEKLSSLFFGVVLCRKQEKAKQYFIAYTLSVLWPFQREKFKANILESILFYWKCTFQHSCVLNGIYVSCNTISISHLNSISFCIKINFPPTMHVFFSILRPFDIKRNFSNNVNLHKETHCLSPVSATLIADRSRTKSF